MACARTSSTWPGWSTIFDGSRATRRKGGATMNTRGSMIGLLLVGAFMTAKAEAASILPLSVEQMTKAAEKIFVGTCVAVEESMNEYGLSVLTLTFTVQDALKGDIGQTVTFRQLNPVQPPPPKPGVGGLWS